VSQRVPGPGVGELVELLATGAHRPLHPGTSVTQLDHALQTAALLDHAYPDDPGLAVAGLVHDIGHLMPGVGDEEHADAGAVAVRGALSARVAGLVALHVEAKRYLVAAEPGYDGGLSPDSVASLAAQGGPLSAAEAGAFRLLPLAPGATALRRADDQAKGEGLMVRDLAHWVPLLRGLSEGAFGWGVAEG
jgi:predicted HD phosphohydrolase